MLSTIVAFRTRIVHSALARRFLSGAAWSVSGAIISNGINLCVMMLVARLLGKSTYGQYVAIQSTIGMVGVFAGFGIGAAATRYSAELRGRGVARLGHILTLAERSVIAFGTIASAGLALGSGWMASHLLNAPNLSVPLSIGAIAVLFTALDSYQKSVLIGLESMRAFASGTVIGVLAGFPIMLMAADKFGLTGAASAMAVNAIIQFCVSRYQMKKELIKFGIRLSASGCLQERHILWSFALPALIAGALVSPAHWATQAMLANTANGYNELAVFGVAMQWFNVIMFLPSTAARVVLPILTDHVTTNDKMNSRKILLYAIGANAIAAVPVALAIGIASPFIMSLYGKGFEQEYFPLLLSVVTATLLAIQTPVGNLIAATSRMWLGALMNAGWAATYVGMAYFLIHRGATGVMIALLAGYAGHSLWTFSFALKHDKSYTNARGII